MGSHIPESAISLAYFLASVSFLTNVVGFPLLLLARKDSKIARSRSILLLTIQWLAFTMMTIVNLFNFVEQPKDYCFYELVVWKIILPWVPVVLLLRGIRQILIFRLSTQNVEEFLKYNDQVIEELPAELPRRYVSRIRALFPDLETQVTDGYLIKVYAVIWAITMFFPLVSVLQTLASGEPLTNACNKGILVFWNYLVGIAAIVMDVIFIIRLRKVHDGFYLKKELLILAITGILGLFAFIPVFFNGWQWLGYLLTFVTVVVINCTSFGYITVMSYLEIYSQGHRQRSSSVSTTDFSVVDPPVFKANPFFYALLTTPQGRDFLDFFLVHYQGSNFAIICLMIMEILEFKKMDDDDRLSQVCFMYQRWIKIGSHYRLPIALELETYRKDGRLLMGEKEPKKEEEKEEEKEVPKDFFPADYYDPLLGVLEEAVTLHLIPRIKRSEEYKDYLAEYRFANQVQKIV
jgi:hypothetical protein